MADHPDITPEEIGRAAAEYLRTGSFSRAAKAIGRSRTATMAALKRASGDDVRRQVYTRALDDAFVSSLAAVSGTVAEMRRDARDSEKPSERASIAFALSDAARTITGMRTAHARLVGDHAPDRVAASVVILPTLDGPPDVSASASPLAAESGPPDALPRQ